MIEAGLAFVHAKPEGFVLSRSGDECAVGNGFLSNVRAFRGFRLGQRYFSECE
ncbi:hypothetical protein JOM56_011289 [Amanita muscaria]